MLSKIFKKEAVSGKKLSRSLTGDAVIFIFLAAIGFFMVLPLVYAIAQAFKPLDEIYMFPPRFFVRRPTLNNFVVVYQLCQNLWVPLLRYVFNSVFVAAAGTAGYIFIASLAAYPLSKHRFMGKTMLSLVIVWALLFRPEVTGVSQYIVIARLNMINTYYAILFPAMSGTFGVFLMKQFMESSIPDSTLEAARIDGAGEFRLFFRIVMPSVKPAWMTLVIFTFQSLWNATGVSYIYNESLKTLPSVLNTISAGGIARAGAGSAVALILMIPPIIIFILSQNSIVETMAHSGLK